jgi:hypothetical protein
MSDLPVRDVVWGPDVKMGFISQRDVVVSNLDMGVRWPLGLGKYDACLILIRDANTVRIQDVAIRQLDENYTGYCGILVENAREVTVRNVRLSGALRDYHLRLEGVDRVLIDNVTIEGHEDKAGGRRGGGGILIDNSTIASQHQASEQWVIIQNSTLSDYTASDTRRNQDAINMTSVRYGLVFNNVIARWGNGNLVADAAVDVSFRHPSLRNGLVQVERNLFIEGNMTKTPGSAHPSNSIAFVNNIYIDTEHVDYHDGYAVYFMHNSMLYRELRNVFRFWETGPHGRTVYRGNHVLSPSRLYYVMSINDQGPRDKMAGKEFDHNLYEFPAPGQWAGGQRGGISDFAEWQKLGNDISSVFVAALECKTYRQVGYKSANICVSGRRATGATSPLGDSAEVIDSLTAKEFFGRRRPSTAATYGAVEASTNQQLP